jgi:hypothetical protein
LEDLKGSELLELDGPPPEQVPPSLHEWLLSLPSSVAFHVPGKDRRRTRAVTALLHGNEPSGLAAIHGFLRSGHVPLTNLLMMLGAVEAAKLAPVFTHRLVPGRRDLNRCFLGPDDDVEGRLAAAMLRVLRRDSPEAVIDLHNNTGHNPAYGVGTRLDAERLGLTSLFAPRFVFSKLRLGALTEALQDELPIVTVECGRRLDPAADACAYAGLCRYVDVETLPRVTPGSGQVDVLHRAVRVRVQPGLRLGFGDHRESGTDVTCALDIDRHNFQTLPAGSHVAWVSAHVERPFVATDESGRDMSEQLFVHRDRAIQTARPFIPIMMTTDPTIALADCLFYAVERW